MGNTIGNRIKAARKRADMTQAALADALGINQSDVSKYENDAKPVPADIMEKIASVTGVAPSVLYGTIPEVTDDLLVINDKYNSLNATGKKRLHDYLDELIQLYPK